jgi:toxin YoeB
VVPLEIERMTAMQTLTPTKFTDVYDLIDQVTAGGTPVCLRGKGSHQVIVMSDAEYRGMLETLQIYSIPGLAESILDALHEPLENYSRMLDWDDLSADVPPPIQKRRSKNSPLPPPKKCHALLQLIQHNPYAPHPPYEKLIGDLEGCLSRRINQQHRLVYKVDEKRKMILVVQMWGHYE